MLRLIFSYTKFFSLLHKKCHSKVHLFSSDSHGGLWWCKSHPQYSIRTTRKCSVKEVVSRRLLSQFFRLFIEVSRAQLVVHGRQPLNHQPLGTRRTTQTPKRPFFLGPKKRESSLLKNHFLLQYFPTSNRSDFLQK